MIKKYTIWGERCSGTNYLQKLIESNFETELTWDYGYKHFFGFNGFDNSDTTLFICIVRNPYDWINSFYKNLHNHPLKNNNIVKESSKIKLFLNNTWYSITKKNGKLEEEMTDRNIYTKKRYKNIFEMRHYKLKYMLTTLPNNAKNCLLIRYEDLIDNYGFYMNLLKKKGLKSKKNIIFPLNYEKYMNGSKTYDFKFDKKKIIKDIIPKKVIKEMMYKKYEKILKYI